MQQIMFIFKPFVVNIKKLLNDCYLNDPDNMDKLNELFKKYFMYKPDDCVNIMKTWGKLLDKLINDNKN